MRDRDRIMGVKCGCRISKVQSKDFRYRDKKPAHSHTIGIPVTAARLHCHFYSLLFNKKSFDQETFVFAVAASRASCLHLAKACSCLRQRSNMYSSEI